MEGIDFTTLPDLVGYLRRDLVGFGPRETLERLQEALGPNIVVKYELTRDASASADIKKSPAGKYSHADGCALSRVLLSTHKKTQTRSELFRRLNGLVLQYPDWKVLSISSPILSYDFGAEGAFKNIDKYDVYPIIDGTVVTLYWYGESWRLSSSNGYDVTDMRWLGAKTYMEALLELTAHYPTFSLDRLVRTCCYTVGFRHNDFHPMQYDGPKLWFIQSCNTLLLNSLSVANIDMSKLRGQSAASVDAILNAASVRPVFTVNVNDDIGLPIQAPIQFPDGMTSEKKAEMLYRHNENALIEFTKSLSGDFVVSPHYGYFLRPRDDNLCDIMYESKLLALIKRALYNFPKKRMPGESELTPDNRLEYAKLRAYLSNVIKYPFITLFPQYSQDYVRYDTLFNRIADRIVQIIRRPTDRKNNDPRIEILAQKFAAHIKDKQISVLSEDGHSIILDFLRDKRYLELYFTILVVN